MGGASYILFLPLLASANFLTDFLQKTAFHSAASDASFNSQTLPVLAAAVNINPNPTLNESTLTMVHGEALMPAENPAGNSDVQTQPTNSQITVYVVRDGDSVSSVAAQFGVSPNTIIGANDIKKGVIHPGQTLIILPITGIQHTILKGETLAGLAQTYRSDAHDIAVYNNLSDTDALTPGQTIIIPSGEVAVEAPAPAATSVSVSSGSTPKTTPKPKTASLKPKVAKSKGFTPAPLRDAGGPEYENYYIWPVGGGIITQSLHGFNGVDIGAPTGADIYASAAGTVIIAKNDGAWNGGYGSYIVIAHDNGTQTLYGHASKVFVSPGDSVTSGELIGKVGRTGEATGPHLHFEIRGATNPFGAIPVGQGE